MNQPKLIKKENCGLHIIDPQEKLMNHIYEGDRVLEKIDLMVECSKVLKIPMVASTQYKKGLGGFPELLAVKLAEVTQIDKIEFNCLASNETSLYYDAFSASISTAILVGVETHICVYQTAIGFLQRNITPWIVVDAVSSRDISNHKAGLKRLAALGCIIGPAEMVVYELLEKAGTREFKEILPFITKRN